MHACAIAPDERILGGRVGGVFYLLSGLSLASMRVVPGIYHAHPVWLLGIAAASIVWGLASLRIDWDAAPDWITHLSAGGAMTSIGLAVAASGGVRSPLWTFLYFLVGFAAYFYPRRVAILYLLACALVNAAPLLYDSRATNSAFLAQAEIAAAEFLVLGGAILAGKEILVQLRVRAEALAAEQGSLGRIATAAVGGDRAEHVYELICAEAARLVGGQEAAIIRLDGERTGTVVGSWSEERDGERDPGAHGAPAHPAAGASGPGRPPRRTVVLTPGGLLAQAVESRLPVRFARAPEDTPIGEPGRSAGIFAPIQVGSSTWGLVGVTTGDGTRLAGGADGRLLAFARLLATVLVGLEDRARLAVQASSDPLTGLANHATLHRRLEDEVARAVRHDRPLSVAVIDIDAFKQINDSAGHDVGDETLVRIANCLLRVARTDDTVGRVGGDEFVWVLPEATAEQARSAVERVRGLISASNGPYRVTISAGVCDTIAARAGAEMLQQADDALFRSKERGRNQVAIYDPDAMGDLSVHERAQRLERSRAVLSLRSLARSIDGKHPATRGHSERVSELARHLALSVGWGPDRVNRLVEAALVHDIGKIAVPDKLLFRRGRLTGRDRAQIDLHAELSATIAEGILTDEQVEWIRHHHERPDGRGYPHGLEGDAISDGAALLAIADAWDVMTVSRPYDHLLTPEQALEECHRLAGVQFTPAAVRALTELEERGELPTALDTLRLADDRL